jgi:basic membrane protein A
MTGFKRRGALVALFLAFALIAAACGTSDDTTTTAAAAQQTTTTAATAETTTTAAAETTTTTEAAFAGEPVLTCLVTDLAGVADQSFNQSAWEGVLKAEAEGFAAAGSRFLESDAEEDWQPNIDVFIAQGCQHIVTVGFFLGGVTAINATEHPEITWTMIDNVLTDEDFVPLNLPNVRELVYQTDQAAFAAGYLAAGVTQTGILGTYGGANIPTVSIFLDGFTRGVAHYNEIKGTDVVVLGWDVEAQDGVFTGSFTDFVLARDTADSLFQEGVDIMIPVGGQINLPAGDAINAGGLDAALVGVDADAFFAMDAQYADLWLTTVEKNILDLVAQSVAQHADGTWSPGTFLGDLSNSGVGLAPFHSWEDRVSAELAAEVEQLLLDIEAGVIKADFFVVD